ncbi:MAG: GNAT family N-acetyltransferase [Pseudomonadota bacterium]
MAEFHYETNRLMLRDWREGDWAPFWEGTNTPPVMQWLGGVLDEQGMIDMRARWESYQRDFGHTFWPVERKEDGSILGFCGLKRCTDQNGPFGMMEVGWRLREDAWGKGYAKEAAIASLDLSFDRFGADETIAITVAENRGSWGLMNRLGMRRRPELDFEDTFWNVDYGNAIVFALTRSQWAEHRASLLA